MLIVYEEVFFGFLYNIECYYEGVKLSIAINKLLTADWVKVLAVNGITKVRSLDITNVELEPVRKKPKISHFSFDVSTMDKPVHHKDCVARDLAWAISSKTNKETPMWTGWNSTITRDELPAQKIGYLANIGAPPTQHDVVNETMKRNVALAKECKEDHMAKTYDLAIVKPASKLQDTMKPKYDNLFVCFRAFHIQFLYLSAMGYLLDGSGESHI